MAKVNFTLARVEAFRGDPGKAQSFLWDAKTPGLALRVTAAGAKAYIYQGKIHGATVRITIGDPRSWTLDQAQERARGLRTQIDQGVDPREHEADLKSAFEVKRNELQRKELRLADVWSVYLQHLRTKISPKTKKPRSERYITDHINLASSGGAPTKRGGKVKVIGPLWPLLQLKFTEINTCTVVSWLEKELSVRPTNASHAFSLFKAFVRWCNTQDDYTGLIGDEVWSSSKITAILPKAKSKDDCLQREQLEAWFAAVRNILNPYISVYLQGLLITGARREELAALRWEDVDFRWRSLKINDKVEGEGGRIIPLTPYFLSLLEELKRIREVPPSSRQQARLKELGVDWEPSPWVFSSNKSANGKIVEPRLAHNIALSNADLPHISLHGLRRSFGTLSEWVEVPVGVVAQIQGHKPSALAEKHYRRRPLDLLRMWHDKIEMWLIEQAKLSI